MSVHHVWGQMNLNINGSECVLKLKFIAGYRYFYFEAELYWDETIDKGAIVCLSLSPKVVF